MFKIGEFSTIARVSTVLLRHYDDLDLFKPLYVDPQTGYRYYSVEQLPRLNRILALKNLGLTLDQVAHLMIDEITHEEIQNMLRQKEAQIAQHIAEEQARLRRVRARLKQIRQQGTLSEHDVVLKAIAPQRYLSLREHAYSLQKMGELYYTVGEAVHQHRVVDLGHCMAVFHEPVFKTKNVDWELGYLVGSSQAAPVPLADGRQLTVRELPAVAHMATVAHHGPWSEMHLGFSAIGAWMEINRHRIAGHPREVYLNLVPPEQDEALVVEIHIPVAEIPK
jgi:DNA-binding transcriptional MerR regulator